MRPQLALFFIALSIFFACLPAQTGLWSKVSSRYSFREEAITLGPAEANAVRAILKSRSQGDLGDTCNDEPAWVDDVKFTAVTLSPARKTVMVEAGAGCARGGQGANGAMWIVQLNGLHPRILASPKENFSGWPFSVQPSSGHGYRDIVLGWHMSASEADLTYFRFDGRSYRSIGHASLLINANSDWQIAPEHSVHPVP